MGGGGVTLQIQLRLVSREKKNHLYQFIYGRICVTFCHGQRVKICRSARILNAFLHIDTTHTTEMLSFSYLLIFFQLSARAFGYVSCQVKREQESASLVNSFCFCDSDRSATVGGRGAVSWKRGGVLKVEEKSLPDTKRATESSRNNGIMPTIPRLTTQQEQEPASFFRPVLLLPSLIFIFRLE